MNIIDRIKLRIPEAPEILLEEIEETIRERMSIIFFNGDDVPEELDYVLVELSVIRFNRIASEGMTSQTVEGETITFSNDDFAPYRADIDAYVKAHGYGGRLRFV